MAKMRAGRAQDLTWRLEAFGFDLFTALIRALPADWASGLGAAIGRAVGPLTGANRTAARNLRLAFPDLADDERARLLKAQWGNVGRVFTELPIMDRLTPASGRVEVVHAERLAAIAASGRPAVFISGHFSNWEIMPAVILAAGIDCEITYRAANNPYVDERIKASRRRYGVKLFAPKGGDGARELLEALSRGVSVAMMNDQKYDGGVAAPFFGRTVHTLPAAVRLALRFGADLQPMSVTRLRGARFRVMVHEPIPIASTGDRAADMEAGVRSINAFIEARVREQPTEWFWVHRRWPPEAYKELADQGY
ncbi:MAG TPA: lysophospholipid acyltransferase family protein [Caulobacteraceae bacterium]|nr:lysophospholipid acyltransferase family protein [Caulobacteraceae bacterium]